MDKTFTSNSYEAEDSQVIVNPVKQHSVSSSSLLKFIRMWAWVLQVSEI